MKWTLKRIQEHRGEPMHFTETVNREASLMERNSEILAISDITVKGFLLYENRTVLASFQIDYAITLPSSRSLEPVVIDMSVPINETYVEDEAENGSNDPSEVVILIEDGEVDLISAVEDAVLLNIPPQVLTEEEKETNRMPAGNSWAVISEDDYQQKRVQEKEDHVDPRLAKLKALLKDEENEE